jgi:hypothetical protein
MRKRTEDPGTSGVAQQPPVASALPAHPPPLNRDLEIPPHKPIDAAAVRDAANFDPVIGAREITLTVKRGEEVYAPIQYHSFRVGEMTATTVVRPGEDAAAIGRALHHMMQVVSRENFREQSVEYLQRMREIGVLVKQEAGR